jgi:hypothetical protein
MSQRGERRSDSDATGAVVRQALESELGTDVDVSTYSQGDAVDVHVEFPDLETSLSESLDGKPVRAYSTLKFAVSRR